MSLDCLPTDGMSIDMGTDAPMTGAVGAASGVGGVDGAAVSVMTSRAVTAWVEALEAQPVRSSKVTAADA